MAIEITKDNFEEIVNQNEKPVVLDFWAVWCGPCKMIAPHIEALADEYADKANICKVDVDSNPEISAKYGVRNIPTVLFLKNGELVDKVVGAFPKKKFEETLQKYL